MNFRRCLEGRRKLLMPEDHVDVRAAREYLTKCQVAEVNHILSFDWEPVRCVPAII